MAWGPMKGYGTARYNLQQAAFQARLRGYEWVALELDDPETGEYNRSIYDDYLTAFRAEGLLAGGWTTEGGSIYLVPSNSDLAIAEVEGPGDYEGLVMVLDGVGAGPMPTCPLAIVTNFSTIDKAEAKILIDAGFSCLPEAYMNENPNITPDSVDRIARNLGWPTSQPVAGVYPTKLGPAPSYAQWADWPLADYLLEYVI